MYIEKGHGFIVGRFKIASGQLKRAAFAMVLPLMIAFALPACGRSDVLALSGTVESTQVDVNSEVAGKITELKKDEGDMVRKGDVLAVVDSSVQELTVKQQEAMVALKKARLEDLKAGTRPEQVKQGEAAAESAQTAVNSAKTGVDNAEINYRYWLDKYNKTRALFDSGSASESELSDAKYRLDTAGQQLASARKQADAAQAQLESAKAQLDMLRNGSTSQTIQAAQADLDQSQAALEQARLVLSKYQVRAVTDGTYLTKNVSLGDMVNAGTGIATLSDLTDLWVKVYVPQKYINRISLNQQLKLTSKALPGKTLNGKVVFVASEAEFTPRNVETEEAKENTVFRVKIKFLDNLDKLKPGMTVDTLITAGG